MSVDHVGLVVGDLEGMAQWWATVLRADIDYRVERPSVPMRAIVLIDAEGFRLELLHRDGSSSAHPRWTIGDSLLAHGFGHVALRVVDVRDEFTRLCNLGAIPLTEPCPGSQPGMMIAFVADPEDNLIELVSR